MSHIVKHGWNGFPISQVVSDFNVQGQSLKAGSTSLTEIAKANGKNVHEFLRLPTIQRWSKAYKDRYGIFPYQTFRGGDMGTWGVLPLAVKMCSWISTDLELWADETIVKVATGQEITNADRAEGWAIASQLGLNLKVEESATPAKPSSLDSEFWSLVDGATSRGLDPAEVIDLHLKFRGVQASSPTDRPSAATVAQKAPKPPKSASKPAQPIVNNNIPSELIRQFADQCIVAVEDDRILSKTDVYDRYVEWCRDRGLRAKGYPAFCAEINALFPNNQVNRTSRMVNGERVPVPAALVSLMIIPKP